MFILNAMTLKALKLILLWYSTHVYILLNGMYQAYCGLQPCFCHPEGTAFSRFFSSDWSGSLVEESMTTMRLLSAIIQKN